MASVDLVPIRISANAPVFDLPILVALREGLFAAAGLNVAYLQNPVPGMSADAGAGPDQQFETQQVDIYNLDAWSSIDRIGRAGRTARISALRPAIVAQAILSFDDTLYNPHDLAGVTIGVNHRKASHYATLQLVSASLSCDDVAVRHLGGPEERLRQLVSGKVRAATLMEPHLSLALSQGAHIIAMTFYRGADVAATELPDEQIDAYYDVLNDAVNLINADFDRYRHFVVAPVADRMAAEGLGRQFVRYTHAETYEESAAVRLSPWMKAWESTLDSARQ